MARRAPGWPPWSGRTPSSGRWVTAGTGITRCSPRCCGSSRAATTPPRCPRCTAGLPAGTSAAGSWTRPRATRPSPATGHSRPSWSSRNWPSTGCSGPAARTRWPWRSSPCRTTRRGRSPSPCWCGAALELACGAARPSRGSLTAAEGMPRAAARRGGSPGPAGRGAHPVRAGPPHGRGAGRRGRRAQRRGLARLAAGERVRPESGDPRRGAPGQGRRRATGRQSGPGGGHVRGRAHRRGPGCPGAARGLPR